jgi:hypothetical protein
MLPPERPGPFSIPKRARIALALLLALLLSAPTQASANGAYSHVHISQLAEALLPGGPLRALLAARRAEYESGSIFPDSGYAAGDGYGEIAHWEPFLSAFVAALRVLHCDAGVCDFSGPEAEARLAFLYGIASHGMADQFYDHTILKRSEELDGPLGDVDRLADYFIIRDPGVDISVAPEGPFADLVAAFAGPGVEYEVEEEVLDRGMRLMAGALEFQGLLARTGYYEAWELHPWLGTHIYDEATRGSLPDLAALVARYWLVVERRLAGDVDPDLDEDFVLRTVPADGAEGVALDRQTDGVCADIGLVFGFGLRTVDLAAAIALEDDEGGAHAITVRGPFNGANGNYFRLEPSSPLAPDTIYHVILDPGAGLETIDGHVRHAPFEFTFRTRAEGAPSDCGAYPPEVGEPLPPPEPTPMDPDAGDAHPATRDSTGCAAGGSAGAHGPWIFTLLLAAWRRREGIFA